jgi:hypothetical protein
MPVNHEPDPIEATRRAVRAWIAGAWDPMLSVRAWWSRLAESGWGFPSWPPQWFGRGLSDIEAAAVRDELAAAEVLGPRGLGAQHGRHRALDLRHRTAEGAMARVMLEGDSVGWSLGGGIAANAASAGIIFANEGYIGCGIATGGQTSFAAYTQPDGCLSWPDRWRSQVDTFRPDVTMVLLGSWELVDRVHNGVWEHIGEPDFDSYLMAQRQTVVQVLSSEGGRVAFLTSPCNDQALANAASPGRLTPDDARRVLLFNALLERTVAQHPGVTEIVPFADLVCPQGVYQPTMNGVTLRTSDGVHMEPYAGDLFDQKLMPQVVSWVSTPAYE